MKLLGYNALFWIAAALTGINGVAIFIAPTSELKEFHLFMGGFCALAAWIYYIISEPAEES
jgi:hypothetical protein